MSQGKYQVLFYQQIMKGITKVAVWCLIGGGGGCLIVGALRANS